MKEKEENMPELTGSITLCPSRKGFRSMRKGRSGKGNSGILSCSSIINLLYVKVKHIIFQIKERRNNCRVYRLYGMSGPYIVLIYHMHMLYHADFKVF